jgi:hypothetical protein
MTRRPVGCECGSEDERREERGNEQLTDIDME